VRELSKVAIKFSKALGIPVDDKNETYLKTMMNEHYGFELGQQASKDGSNEPEVLNFDSTIKKKDSEAIMQIQKLHRFKFLFIIYDMVEFDEIPDNIDNYSLVYNMFGEKVKLKLASKKTFNAGVPIVPVNKIRLHYFFSDDRVDLNKFINHGSQIIKLYHKNELISKVELDINDFRSADVNQKSYYIPFISDKFSCYLRCMIGIEMDAPEAINVTTTKLSIYHGLYLPPRDYMSCQPLTEEWEQRIPNLHKYNTELSALIAEAKKNGNKMPIGFPLVYLPFHHQFSQVKESSEENQLRIFKMTKVGFKAMSELQKKSQNKTRPLTAMRFSENHLKVFNPAYQRLFTNRSNEKEQSTKVDTS
jgi:hypothetical protein